MATPVTSPGYQAALLAPSHVPTFAPTAVAPRSALSRVFRAWSNVTGPVYILNAPSHAECHVIDLLAISHVQSAL